MEKEIDSDFEQVIKTSQHKYIDRLYNISTEKKQILQDIYIIRQETALLTYKQTLKNYFSLVKSFVIKNIDMKDVEDKNKEDSKNSGGSKKKVFRSKRKQKTGKKSKHKTGKKHNRKTIKSKRRTGKKSKRKLKK